jgi:transcription termination factor Rho
MSEGQQLERSVLEAKERDELHAIAEALGLKPSARAAKATLVGLILRATGVEQEGDAPPRTRSSRGRRGPVRRPGVGQRRQPGVATGR